MQLTCPKCKTANQENARFCSSCGVAFAVAPIQAKPKANQNRIAVACVVLLAFLLLILSLGDRGEQNKKATLVSQTNTSLPPTPAPTATPAPTFAELTVKTEELIKRNIEESDIAGLKPYDVQMESLRAVLPSSKDHAAAQVQIKKLINKTAPIIAALALLGPKPESSAYDGRVEPVVKYLKATMNDYEDSEWIEWSPVVKMKLKGEPYWVVRLKLRGKNGFGAKILKNMLFYIRNNQVVNTMDLPL
jgi:hypothetical protein